MGDPQMTKINNNFASWACEWFGHNGLDNSSKLLFRRGDFVAGFSE